MNPVLFLGIAIAGGLGAVLRWAIDTVITRRVRGTLPWGILVVNASGSLALGILTGLVHDADLARILGVGLLGGYTTFSAVAATTALMLEERTMRAALVNAFGSLLVCVLAALAGLGIAMLLR